MKCLAIHQLRDLGILYSRAHLYRLIRKNAFPKPVRIGAHRIAFVESEIQAWLESKVAERDAKEVA